MTRSDRTFPLGPRLLALSIAVAALVVSVPIVGAQAGPSASDVEQAHQDYLAAEAEIRDLQSQIEATQVRLARAVTILDREQSALAEIETQIAATQQRISDAQARYDAIQARLDERVAQAFMAGGGSDIEILLGATSLDNLSDRVEFVDAVARSDTELAHQVANLRASLEFEEQTLEQLKVEQEQKVADQKKVQQGILDDLSRVNALRDQAAAVVEQTFSTYQNVQKQYHQYQQHLRELAQQAITTTSAPHTSVDLPPGFKNPLEVCPVDDPRAFGDGFGAPRYAGGFHLHAGVDITANYGTKIRAPFDGIAKPAYNTLGGYSEYVYAADGTYVYNAHLDHYAPKSTGPVRAGDVIGYVGDTGDATGSPHDHFEWHPAVIPANWPASYYGYTVIGPTDAVNPYPILVDVCG
jgi:murein DD-endopeptidase MepM/ murein hydrolase activator NlpD